MAAVRNIRVTDDDSRCFGTGITVSGAIYTRIKLQLYIKLTGDGRDKHGDKIIQILSKFNRSFVDVTGFRDLTIQRLAVASIDAIICTRSKVTPFTWISDYNLIIHGARTAFYIPIELYYRTNCEIIMLDKGSRAPFHFKKVDPPSGCIGLLR